MENSKVGFSLFGLFVIALIIGGFYFMKQSSNKLDNGNAFEKDSVSEKIKDIRIDNTKDYIYFANSSRVVEELDIDYREIYFNFGDNQELENELNEENKELKDKLKYDEKLEDDAYNKLVYAKYNIYNVYTYENYLSLVIDYYEFNQEDIISYLYTKTYVFDKSTGTIIDTNKLLENFKLTEDDVLDKIKNYVDDQDILKDGEELDSEQTIKNIDTLAIYVDKIGRLTVSVLVKSNQKDYNENIILN